MAVMAARYPGFFSQPGARIFLIEPMCPLIVYAVAIALVLRLGGLYWNAILNTAIVFGVFTGILEVVNIGIENGVPFLVSGSRMALGSMLVVFTLWGVAGFSTSRSLRSMGSGLIAAVASACICMLIAVAAGFAVELFLASPDQATIATWVEYKRSGWTDPRAFGIANTLESAFTHLVVAPIVATVVGGAGALVARWYTRRMRSLIAIVAVVVLSQVANAQKTISFSTADGAVIFADLYGKGDNAVVLAHGGRFNKESWAKQAERLAASGFEVLALDFRGYGKSRGPGDSTPMDAPLHLDVLAAVCYLRAKGAKGVSVVGGSMGGGAAGDASIASQPGEIDRLIFLGASPNGPADKLKSASLYIVARDDANEDGRRLPRIREQYEKSPQPKQLILLDGLAHAQFLFQTDQAERVMSEILHFLSENLAAPAGPKK